VILFNFIGKKNEKIALITGITGQESYPEE